MNYLICILLTLASTATIVYSLLLEEVRLVEGDSSPASNASGNMTEGSQVPLDPEETGEALGGPVVALVTCPDLNKTLDLESPFNPPQPLSQIEDSPPSLTEVDPAVQLVSAIKSEVRVKGVFTLGGKTYFSICTKNLENQWVANWVTHGQVVFTGDDQYEPLDFNENSEGTLIRRFSDGETAWVPFFQSGSGQAPKAIMRQDPPRPRQPKANPRQPKPIQPATFSHAGDLDPRSPDRNRPVMNFRRSTLFAGQERGAAGIVASSGKQRASRSTTSTDTDGTPSVDGYLGGSPAVANMGASASVVNMGASTLFRLRQPPPIEELPAPPSLPTSFPIPTSQPEYLPDDQGVGG